MTFLVNTSAFSQPVHMTVSVDLLVEENPNHASTANAAHQFFSSLIAQLSDEMRMMSRQLRISPHVHTETNSGRKNSMGVI